MNIEATVKKIEIIKAKAEAAQHIAEMELARIQLDRDDETLRIERLWNMAGDKEAEQALNDQLRKEIPKLWWNLVNAPESDKLKEVAPSTSPNGQIYWRELDIDGVGRIDVTYVPDSSRDEQASYFALQVPDLPIVEGRSRAKECVLVTFEAGKPIRGCTTLMGENAHLLNVHETLMSICNAAGAIESSETS